MWFTQTGPGTELAFDVMLLAVNRIQQHCPGCVNNPFILNAICLSKVVK